MPRQPRIDIPGLLYHVIIRGIEKKEIFRDDIDRKDFLSRIEKSLEGSKAKVFAWALMPNHAHLLIRTGEKPLSRIMSKLLTGYAVNFNLRHRRAGHLFQNRYKSIVCDEEEYLLELIRYIHLNPLKAGIVKDTEELSKYNWSGHSAIMGKSKNSFQEIDEVIERFASSRKAGSVKYNEFLCDGIGQEKPLNLSGGGLIRSMGGLDETLKANRGKQRDLADDRILGLGSFVEGILDKVEKEEKISKKTKKELSLMDLIEKIGKYYNVKPSQIKGKRRLKELVNARAVVCHFAKEYLGLTGRQLEKELNLSSGGVSILNSKGEEIVGKEEKIKKQILSY